MGTIIGKAMCVHPGEHSEKHQRLPQAIRKATDATERAMKASSGILRTMRGITSFGAGSGSITSCSHPR